MTYQVPSPDYGFKFKVTGPAGLERVKAIVALNKVPLLKLDLEKGFHSVERGTARGTRTIQALSKQVGSVGIDLEGWVTLLESTGTFPPLLPHWFFKQHRYTPHRTLDQ